MESSFQRLNAECCATIYSKLNPADRGHYGSSCRAALAGARLNKLEASVRTHEITTASLLLPNLRSLEVRCGARQAALQPSSAQHLLSITGLVKLSLHPDDNTVVSVAALLMLSDLRRLQSLELVNWPGLDQPCVGALATLTQLTVIAVHMRKHWKPQRHPELRNTTPPADYLSKLPVTKVGAPNNFNFLRAGGAAAIANMEHLLALDVSGCGAPWPGMCRAHFGKRAQQRFAMRAQRLLADAANTFPKLFSGPGLQQLVRLNVSCNPYLRTHLGLLTALPCLRDLEASDCELHGVGAVELCMNLPLLTHLDIACNQLDDDGAPAIAALQQLTYLDISDNALKDEGAAMISTLAQLRHLEIACNPLGGGGVAALAALTQLTRLNAQGAQANDAAAITVANSLPRLRFLDLSKCADITLDCVHELSDMPRQWELKLDGL